jgi:GntR family transcriptional regulator/MocR family aminotransferase
MVKRTRGAILQSIQFDPESARSLTTQILIAVRNLILSGGLRTGERLPSTRTLAKDLGVSRNTIVGVFDRLLAEGLLEARIGAGTFIINGH